MWLVTFIVLIIFLAEAFAGSLSIFGIIYIGSFIIGIVIYVVNGKAISLGKLDYRIYLSKGKK